jgi:hypothetical protein
MGHAIETIMMAVNVSFCCEMLCLCRSQWHHLLEAQAAVCLLVACLPLTLASFIFLQLLIVCCITDKLMGHAIETIMMAVNSGAAPTSRSLGVKFLFIAWAIFSVIMLAAYTGSQCNTHPRVT